MRFSTTSVAALAVAGLVAGCGGSTTSAPPASTSAANVSASSATAPSTAAANATSSAAPSFASSQNCQQLVALGVKYAKALSPAAGGGQIDLAAVLKADQALADATPSAIHSDAELVVHAFSGYVSTITNLGYKPGTIPTATQIAAITSAAQQLNQSPIKAALARLTSWVHQNCHL